MGKLFPDNLPQTLLGGLSAEEFLAEYWQKKPLLVRGAIPGFTGLLDKDEMFDLACDPDVESRWVAHDDSHWQIKHGPQKASDLRKKKHPWTVLVQGLNLFLPEGDRLLDFFNFVPRAQLDDLMVSYAVDGGGVGPHFDNYNVFLLQGIGQRRWRIGDQKDQTLIEGIPLRILKDFQPVYDWVLNPGDMLYLPPAWAHDGVAIGECMTYSVGFRSLNATEIGQSFLAFLQENLCLEGLYADPDLKLAQHNGEIPPALIEKTAEWLQQIRWDNETVARCLGRFLTEPKPHVYFDAPESSVSRKKFLQSSKHGVRLDTRTQLLFSGNRFFLNGEEVCVSENLRPYVIQLADSRGISDISNLSDEVIEFLLDWHQQGLLWSADPNLV